jgi:S-adenosylmethionine:tRNA ribosyltransferase-isomerase
VKPFENINLSDYTYDLPDDRIAAYPAENREDSLLLVRDSEGNISHDRFRNLADYLGEGSHLVFNNSRVIPARLIFSKPTGSKIELFCLAPLSPARYEASLCSTSDCIWECMVGNLKRFTGQLLHREVNVNGQQFELHAEKLKQAGNLIQIRFSWQAASVTFDRILSAIGKTPLPPYIKREPDLNDRERYQTIYSRYDGSVAAPTAGLHFTNRVFDQLAGKNISFQEVTLHVGAGTFQPIKTDQIAKHVMHAEFIQVTRPFIRQMASLNEPVIAVGTTSVRTLESLYWLGVKLLEDGNSKDGELSLDQWEAYQLRQDVEIREAFGSLDHWLDTNRLPDLFTSTRLMIVPGYRFRVVDTLITNFHQPDSTLLLLVAAFMGSSWKAAYQYALDHGFRFLSYGDSSVLFRSTNGY